MQARRAHLDADEAEGGGEEPNSPGHQHRHGDPQPHRFAVPAQQRLAAKAPASTEPIESVTQILLFPKGKKNSPAHWGLGNLGSRALLGFWSWTADWGRRENFESLYGGDWHFNFITCRAPHSLRAGPVLLEIGISLFDIPRFLPLDKLSP